VDRLDYLKRENPYFIYRINNKEGFITLEGKTEPIYDEVLTYDGDIFFVSKLNEWRILKNDCKPYNTEIYTNFDGNNSNFVIMKNKGELQYFSIKQNSFKDFGKILDYKVGFPSGVIALKIENKNWLLYNTFVDSFLSYTFDTLSFHLILCPLMPLF
jgi:hypothetical protein